MRPSGGISRDNRCLSADYRTSNPCICRVFPPDDAAADRAFVGSPLNRSDRQLLFSTERPPKSKGLTVQPSLLENVDRIPNKTLEPLNVGFALSDGSVLASPLPNECPRSTVLVQELDEMFVSRLGRLNAPLALSLLGVE